MREVASQVSEWVRDGREVALARIMAMDGFGGRRAGEAWAMTRGEDPIGSLMMGAADAELAESAASLLAGSRRLVVLSVPVGDVDAVAAGLACGGIAHIAIQRASALPASIWTRIAAREPVALATVIDGPSMGVSAVFAIDRTASADLVVQDGSLGPGAADAAAMKAATEQLTRGRDLLNNLEHPTPEIRRVLVEAIIPPSHMVVIGAVNLAQALVRQGALLGWTTMVVDETVGGGADSGVAASAALGPVDALVVLSHDVPASARALAAALQGHSGYVGALGSRHTQSARSTYLRETLELDADDIARVHGPVGLDIGSRTPEETALAIYAEVLAHRAGRSAQSLKGRSGPING